LPTNVINETIDQTILVDSKEEIKHKEKEDIKIKDKEEIKQKEKEDIKIKDKEEIKQKEKEEVKLKDKEEVKLKDDPVPYIDIKTKRHSLNLKLAVNKEAFPGIPLYVADDPKKESKKTLIIRPFKGLVKDDETDKSNTLTVKDKDHKKEKKDRAISPSIKRFGSVEKLSINK